MSFGRKHLDGSTIRKAAAASSLPKQGTPHDPELASVMKHANPEHSKHLKDVCVEKSASSAPNADGIPL